MPIVSRPLAWIAVCAAGLCLGGARAAAQDVPQAAQTVVAVRVLTESGNVLEENPPKLTLQPGQPYSTHAERESLRELYRSGRFADLHTELADVSGGVRVDYVVRQNFFLNNVQISGLVEPPSESQALSALRLGLGEVFDQSALQDALDRLKQTLEDEGDYQAKLSDSLNPHPDTLEMDIEVHVVPGVRARVGKVTLANETPYSNDEVGEKLGLKAGHAITSAWLQRDTEHARKWLANEGYLGARVTLHRGAYDATTNTVPMQAVLYAGLAVRVQVTGAKVSQRTLRRLIPIYQEGAVDEDLLQEGRRALRDYFENDGYFDTQVSYATSLAPEEKSGGVVHPASELVTYQVQRGDRRRLVGIGFTGNKYFSTELLTGRLRLARAGVLSRGRYSTALLEGDVASIKGIYNANGFHAVKVDSKIIEDYQGHRGDLYVQIQIQEGLQTRVAELRLEGNKALKEDELLSVLSSSAGQPYSEFNVSTDRDNILALYYDQGFPDAKFSATEEPVPVASGETVPRVQLTYHLDEGAQVRVARILLGGYEHARPGVISREVAIRTGEPLSEGAVAETQRNLYNLGIFNRVSVAAQNPGGDDPDKTMLILVDEAKRYTIAYGLGLEAQRIGSGGTSAVAGTFRVSPRATFEISKNNLTGRADQLSFKMRASTLQGRALLAYTAQNYFAKPNFSLQMSAFFDKTRDVQTFTSTRYEGSVQLADRLSSTSSLLYRYAYRHILATDLQIAPLEIPLFNQPTQVSELGVSWLRDHRDDPANPARGEFDNADVALALKPLGSSANFIRVFFQNSTYHPVGRRFVFARSTRFGMQTPYGNSLSSEIPLPERFFAGGGTTLRGFGLNQAGPRDPVTGFPIGGQALLVFNQDLRFPMHLPLIGNRLGGAIFYDAGDVFSNVRQITLRLRPPSPVFDSTNPTTCLYNCGNELNYFSHTVGFELRYGTPIGPVSLDLAYQLNPAHFLIPAVCTPPATSCGSTLTRLPGFQFFLNLGTTF